MNNKHSFSDEELYETIAMISSPQEAREFFADLCTPVELAAFAQRLTAARLLMSGYTYEQVIAATDISSATLSRVSKCVKGGAGYKKFVKLDHVE